MDKTLEKSLLFDFYGELLTEHQREIFQMHYLEDLSLGEISDLKEITRQGVFDLLKRSEKTLLKFESRLGLVNKFMNLKDRLGLLNEEILCLENSLKNSGNVNQKALNNTEKIKNIISWINNNI